MAKKGINRIVIAGLGVGVLIAVIVPVMFLVFGIGVEFEIVFTDIDEFIDQYPVETLPFEKELILETEIGEEIVIETEQFTEIVEVIDQFPVGTLPVEQTVEIFEMVENSGEIPPEVPTLTEVTLITETTKVDSEGNLFFETTETEFFLFTLFVEDISNIDFSKGRIETSLKIRSDPNTQISGQANFEILIANQTIFTQPQKIEVSGITDVDGILEIDFVNPIGLLSKQFLLNIEEQTPKIQFRGITQFQYIITDFVVTANNIDYQIDRAEIFSFNLFRDPNLILITDSGGEQIRVFPTDDRFLVQSVGGKVCYTFIFNQKKCLSLPAPIMGSVQLFDDKGVLLSQSLGESIGTRIDFTVQRNETYKLVCASPTPCNFITMTPEEQKDYNYFCTSVQGITNLVTVKGDKFQVPDGITRTVCNFPSW